VKKIEIFKDNSEIHSLPSGATYMTGTWAKVEAEAFINREGIKVLDIKYSNGFNGDAILIVYEEMEGGN
jgi:hypothetical protein